MACSNSGIFLAIVAAIAGIDSASAADMAVRARPAAVDPGYNWSGFYIGANAGDGWGERSGQLAAFNRPGNPGRGCSRDNSRLFQSAAGRRTGGRPGWI